MYISELSTQLSQRLTLIPSLKKLRPMLIVQLPQEAVTAFCFKDLAYWKRFTAMLPTELKKKKTLSCQLLVDFTTVSYSCYFPILHSVPTNTPSAPSLCFILYFPDLLVFFSDLTLPGFMFHIIPQTGVLKGQLRNPDDCERTQHLQNAVFTQTHTHIQHNETVLKFWVEYM